MALRAMRMLRQPSATMVMHPLLGTYACVFELPVKQSRSVHSSLLLSPWACGRKFERIERQEQQGNSMEQTACSGYSAKHRTQRRHFATSAAVANDEVDVAAAFEEIQAAGLLPPDPPLPSPLPVRQEPRQRRQGSDEPSHYTPVYTNKHGSKKAKVKTKMKTMTTTKMKTKKKKKKKMQKNETATRTETKTEKTTWLVSNI